MKELQKAVASAKPGGFAKYKVMYEQSESPKDKTKNDSAKKKEQSPELT